MFVGVCCCVGVCPGVGVCCDVGVCCNVGVCCGVGVRGISPPCPVYGTCKERGASFSGVRLGVDGVDGGCSDVVAVAVLSVCISIDCDSVAEELFNVVTVASAASCLQNKIKIKISFSQLL